MVQMKRKIKFWLLISIFVLGGFLSIFFLKTGFTINQVIGWDNENEILSSDNLPKLPDKDPNRINILLLGMRGLGENGEGQLLSDTLIILSIKKPTGQVALISIPRDIYLKIWCAQEKEKINFAYAYGGFDCAKKTVSYLSGLYIDYAVSSNFGAFKEIVDALGGISLYLPEPFEEDFQWAKEGGIDDEHWLVKEFDGEERWVFCLPQGENILDGKTALYYVRSRYSTDDFDRMHRQQQVLLAIKEKALSLGVLANPVKIYNLLDILGKNIKTDMSLTDIGNLINLASDLDMKNIKRKVFDIGSEGLLYHTFIDKEYVLLPVGDNFKQIQQACQNIFD